MTDKKTTAIGRCWYIIWTLCAILVGAMVLNVGLDVPFLFVSDDTNLSAIEIVCENNSIDHIASCHISSDLAAGLIANILVGILWYTVIEGIALLIIYSCHQFVTKDLL